MGGQLPLCVVVACLLALLALTGCAPARVAAPPPAPPVPLPSSADGLAFVHDGDAFVVRDGSLHEVAAGGAEKVAVGYSTDGTRLLVTEVRGSRRVVLMVARDGRGSAQKVLDTDAGSNLGAVRAVMADGRLYRTLFGAPWAQLAVSGLALGSESATIPLGAAFSGEYDIDAAGSSIVYTGAGQNPAVLMVRTGAIERPLVAGLATAFTPAFSRDGGRVCFTGSGRAGDPLSVHIVDTKAGLPRVIAETDGLRPTSPVFSPDGAHIAFRSAVDGALWLVATDGGIPQRLDVVADDLPIAW